MDDTRRSFLQQATVALGSSQLKLAEPATRAEAGYPRIFQGRQLARIAFPLGGVAAGSLSLGGRGQLRDWEIFNKPNKGFSPPYAFPSIWAQSGSAKPVARVLEARIQPPYEGQTGLGSDNAPGLSRLASARFTGEYPLARIDFEDPDLPVKVSLDAFSPFIPHDADDSGLPVAILRYHVTNSGRSEAKVAIAFSIDNPVKVNPDERLNEYRDDQTLAGLMMTNPGAAATNPMRGSFALSTLKPEGAAITHWRGWPKSRWWNSPMLFWDQFSAHGEMGPEPENRGTVGALCVRHSIAPGKSADYTFLLAWHFPNRTPAWCHWSAPKGDEDTIIGNYYTTRFSDAWDAARYAAQHLGTLESRTRTFAIALRESTLPAAVKEAASANLSTLASTTCFRTADGEFHGFEGANDHAGCCSGNCTHVWNYESATAHLFPSLARSLRKASFGYSMDDAGAMHFRQMLPDGKQRSDVAAADGQMGQIMHAYLDWSLSGDNAWLRQMWPRIKKGLEFAWAPGGWDADRDGVLEGVQHNTYDVEFYGPNPMCGIYYLGALRAGEEMARAVGDNASATEYRRLFESGRAWIDSNLFNGEYYIQKVRGFPKSQVAPSLRSTMGADDTEHPEYQVGEGCLVDQLVGQYMAEVAGLGPLISQKNVHATLNSIYRYNYKRSLSTHDTVQRTFALNEEAALVICDYGKAERPRIPFPYYAEVMTGFEYSTATHMRYAGMVKEGVECIRNIRARYDGEKRNPWDEAECGHHYARAMASWSGILALSGFRYRGQDGAVTIAGPRAPFRCFWSTGTGWGVFTIAPNGAHRIRVMAGGLPCRSCEIQSPASSSNAMLDGKPIAHKIARQGNRMLFQFDLPLTIAEGSTLEVKA